MSSGEERAWQVLRLLRKEGVHVVRQHKIGRYTVDFAVRKARLAIEIDGAVHAFPGRAEYDAARQAHLESKGWRFVRIPSETTRDARALVEAVIAALPLPSSGGGGGWGGPPQSENNLRGLSALSRGEKQTGDSASPHPLTPSPQGEGESRPFPRELQRRTRANRKLKPRRRA